ncbi:flagellin N-terminal helical domain-containing protein [Acidicapsa ligni]|uniref:flagellin N-terminal helical domain-containing protein n=1 Tax=Acidicapsa ligni TaxID=542300 RepID=UPI0021DF4CF9|nr:flagellin [Acidicapsa ligni]
MALGVLNNISALYAENSLNSTNSSLQTVLTQLSSGSKINSGSDDAAGLSLVNGLQANATALTQSATNATEGVGLLQVADGALSQVTSLLNRAVTLATEVSNGTLNNSQDAAANQEYQSILSEINSIGQTTTYNSNQVFTGAAAGTNIYTGDSSTSGSSIDNLYFAPLSSSTVGDSGGSVVQSSSGEFIDLSLAATSVLSKGATAADTITGGLTFTTTNADGTTSTIATTATTVGGLVAEINEDGIAGVTASLTTAGAVGDAAGATTALADTGILVSNTNGNVIITNTGGTTPGALLDTTTGEGATALVASTAGTETISYQQGANEQTSNLAAAGIDLANEGDAQATVKVLNAAISNVAAQRGYLGAQVNTLNAVSQVVSTQQENITSAQNAVQATDYAAATTALSKYEILSQTGISALAQANSLQQEVTKLLQ